MRCPDCNSFVPTENGEPEINSESIDADDGTVTADIRLVLLCGNCGTELAESTQEVEIAAGGEHDCNPPECETCGGTGEIGEGSENEGEDCPDCDGTGHKLLDPSLEPFELQEIEAEPTDRYQDTDRHGKPIKNFRYQRHYYGAEVRATVLCNRCSEEFVAEGTVEEQASAFESLI